MVVQHGYMAVQQGYITVQQGYILVQQGYMEVQFLASGSCTSSRPMRSLNLSFQQIPLAAGRASPALGAMQEPD